MSMFEAIFIWAAVFLYGITSALYIYCFVFKNEKVLEWLSYIVSAAFIFHTAGILARYYAIGNMPVAGDYENALGGTWIIAAFSLYISIRYRPLRVIGVAVMPVILILLGYGIIKGSELAPMSASVRSFWLYIHVFFAQIAFGAFTIAFAFGIIYLLKEKNPEKDFYKKFPSLSKIDELMFRYLIFGFITDAVMIASGSIWAKNLWGNYWSWDPVETWSLVTWVIYGVAIHLRVTMGWRGRRLAWIVIFALSGMIITYFGINIFVKTSLHLFEAWQKM